MNRQEIIQALEALVKPYLPDDLPADLVVTEETDFIRDLKINSANLVDIILDIEDEYDITIDNESMEKLSKVGDAIDIIQSKLV